MSIKLSRLLFIFKHFSACKTFISYWSSGCYILDIIVWHLITSGPVVTADIGYLLVTLTFVHSNTFVQTDKGNSFHEPSCF